jgi:uncharacterized NAD(P)/FAD-binding protein YdhS
MQPLRLAIIGGGFTGVALTIHALKLGASVSIEAIEPSAKLGRGAAYGTTDSDHRINVPSDRMSLFSADSTHFTRWLFDNKWLPDAESVDPLGRSFPPRSAFGAYVEDVLARTGPRCAPRTSLRHRQARAVALAAEDQGFRIELEDGASLHVDRVAICTGHVPGAPCRVSEDAARHPRFIANPWALDLLNGVRKTDSLLIVGTGLTMVDVVATPARRDHRGPIVAVSSRGLLPCDHGQFVDGLALFEGARPRSALELLCLLRATVRVLERTRYFALAESLGGVESLIGHPWTMSHASIPEALRRAAGITSQLVRLSIAIEDASDLIRDLEQALEAA